MDNLKSADLVALILGLDTRLQRQIYAGWPASWTDLRWPVGSIRALLIIEAGFARTPGEVADVLKVGRTSVTGILDRLENDALITRTLDPNDRRSFTLAMTDAGRALVRDIDELRRGQMRRALGDLDAADLRALQQGLQALSVALDRGRAHQESKQEEIES